MNNQRRKLLDDAVDLINRAESLIEKVAAEERDAFDAMPASLQEAERGLLMQDCLLGLEDGIPSHFDDLRSAIDAALCR